MKLKSHIDPNSEAFAKTAAHHRALVTQLRERTAQVALGGSGRLHVKRGNEVRRFPMSARLRGS